MTMVDNRLFEKALGIKSPWHIVKVDFDDRRGRLDIFVDFVKGAKFVCPECQSVGGALDTKSKTWRHLDFFEHTTYIHARVPRMKCGAGHVLTVDVPWASKPGFTLMFEAYVMRLVRDMPVNAAAAIVCEWDTRLWRIVMRYIEAARAKENFSRVTRVGIDETQAGKGHDYITIFVDLDRSKVLFATEGSDAATVGRFVEDLEAHGGKAENIDTVCIDMSPAFKKGVVDHLPNATITYDKFHVTKIVNDAVDKVRRKEVKEREELRGTRYLWLKNRENLTEKQLEKFVEFDPAKSNLKTARAYRMKLAFQEIYTLPAKVAEHGLRRWIGWTARSRLTPMKRAGKTMRQHFDGIVQWFKTGVTNGVLEGINSLIQAAKVKARGFRNKSYFIACVYLTAGKLDQNWIYPH